MAIKTENATCPKCGRGPVTVYTDNHGVKQCGKCMQKSGRR